MTTAAAENRKVAHTPGPWERVLICRDAHGCVREQLVSQGRAALQIIHDGSPEGRANAQLATAAPDLLAALRLALARYESAKRLHVGRFVNDDADMATIRAAIARAE